METNSSANEQPRRSIEQIRDRIREYESRPDRPAGHIVCRYVADMEPEVFAQIAVNIDLTEADLLRYIEDVEKQAGPTLARSPSEYATEERKLRAITENDPDDFENLQGQIASSDTSTRPEDEES